MFVNGRLTSTKIVRFIPNRMIEGKRFISSNSLFIQQKENQNLKRRINYLNINHERIKLNNSHYHHRKFSTSKQNNDSFEGNKKVVDYLLADVGEGITECEIVKWFVEPGSYVEEFDNLVEVQSDKASVEITSRYSGVVVEHCYQIGQVAKVGSPLCRIRLESNIDTNIEEGEEVTNVKEQEEEQETVSIDDSITSSSSSPLPNQIQSEKNDGRHATLATPAVRRLTKENGIQIKDVQGTGKDGRVTKEDVQNFIKNQNVHHHQEQEQQEQQKQTFTLANEMKNIPLSGVRKAMFKAMSTTWNAPHFGYSDEIDVTELDLIRKKLNKTNENQSRLTLLPFLLKAISITLNDHPLFRSTFNVQDMMLKQSEEHRLSIAFASSKGLITPTLQGDSRSLSILDIANQINNLQIIGATRGLNQTEMGNGATITLSNIGSIGGTHTFPLIPPTGQLIIGAIGRTRILPRFDGDPKDGKIKAANILPVSFSADHRIVEGIELAKFVNDWKQLIENPSSWMLKMH